LRVNPNIVFKWVSGKILTRKPKQISIWGIFSFMLDTSVCIDNTS